MIADTIRKLRDDLKMSRSEFARKTGVSESAIANVESGRFAPGKSFLEKVSVACNVSLHELAMQTTAVEEDPNQQVSERDLLIGQKIKYYRTIHDITQEELSKMLGYSAPSAISMIERGQRGISKQKLLKFCKLLDIHISSIIIPEESKHSDDPVYRDFLALYNAPKKPEVYETIKQLIQIGAKELHRL